MQINLKIQGRIFSKLKKTENGLVQHPRPAPFSSNNQAYYSSFLNSIHRELYLIQTKYLNFKLTSNTVFLNNLL
jgi:hypothetical protein